MFWINLTNRKNPSHLNYHRSIKKSQAILKHFIHLKFSVWFTLGSENETMFCDTCNFFQLPLSAFRFPLSSFDNLDRQSTWRKYRRAYDGERHFSSCPGNCAWVTFSLLIRDQLRKSVVVLNLLIAIPPVVVKTRGVNVPCSKSITLSAYGPLLSLLTVLMLLVDQLRSQVSVRVCSGVTHPNIEKCRSVSPKTLEHGYPNGHQELF